MLKSMTVSDLVHVCYVNPVFTEKTNGRTAEIQAVNHPGSLLDTRTQIQLAVSDERAVELSDGNSRHFKGLLSDINSLGDSFNPNLSQEDVSKKYERKVSTAIIARPEKIRSAKRQNKIERQNVRRMFGINAKSVAVFSWKPEKNYWCIHAKKAYALLKKGDDRFLLGTALLKTELKKVGSSYVTLRLSKDGSKILLNDKEYEAKSFKNSQA